jgi:hypothetical protein
MPNQHVHQVSVAHCVDCRNDDGVELDISRDRGEVLKLVAPWNPLPHVFFDEHVVIDLSLFWEWNWERFLRSIAGLEKVILGPAKGDNGYWLSCTSLHWEAWAPG